MKMLLLLLLSTPALFALVPDGQVITTLTLREKAGVTTSNYPLTFGHVFRRGDVAGTVSIKNGSTTLSTQCDIKRRWDDGSIRHAVISVVIPSVTANSNLLLSLVAGGTNAAGSGEISISQILATNFDAKIVCSNMTGGLSAASDSVSARPLVAGTLNYWLKGAVCSDILLNTKMDSALGVRWEARFYPGTSFGIRISHCLENCGVTTIGRVVYDLKIAQGTSNTQVYTKTGVYHGNAGRWHKVFWLGTQPPATEVRYNFAYMKATGAVLNYSEAIILAETDIASAYSSYSGSNHDIGGTGTVTGYMPTTGGRADIGPLPGWTVDYLLTMDNRLKEKMLGNCDLAAMSSSHFREDNPVMNYFGHAVSVEDRPAVSFNLIWNGASRAGTPPFVDSANSTPGWTAQMAHLPELSYIPYLVTGDYWYMEELAYWAAWVISVDYGGRRGTDGIITGEMRGHAWAERTLANGAWIMPDGSIEKTYFERVIDRNLTKDIHMAIDSFPTPLHLVMHPSYSGNYSPWQHDYYMCALTGMVRQGYAKAKILRDWFAVFTIERFTNPADFNPYCGCGYYWPVYTTTPNWKVANDSICAREAGCATATSFGGDYAGGYRGQAHAALASVVHLTKGQQAYNVINAGWTPATFKGDAEWGIFPDTMGIDTGRNVGVEQARTNAKFGDGLALSAQPNPFNPDVTLHLSGVMAGQNVSLRIYDVTGSMVANLTEQFKTGLPLIWNAKGMPSGFYMVRATAGSKQLTKKLVLAK